jgi:hypothetical protein
MTAQGSSAESAAGVLATGLRARRAEIEDAVLTRILAVSAASQELDPEYAEGLPGAVQAAIGYGFDALELGAERVPPPPPLLLARARLAARSGVGLDTVLRRYFAGHSLVADFLVGEAKQGGPSASSQLQFLLRSQASVFERLLAAVSEEHARESENRLLSTEELKSQRIERLLAGELIDVSRLDYELQGSHLGLMASGPNAYDLLRELAGRLDRHLLVTRRRESLLWAWLGGRSQLDPAEPARIASDLLPEAACLAIGEPGEGLAGWRLSHRQAKAALPIAQRGSDPVVRYADVALLASVIQDDVLTASLRENYLEPLRAARDGGKAARETLRAYFAAGRNVSSTAARLGVNRSTVTSRLRIVEESLGRSLESCSGELEAALRLQELSGRIYPINSRVFPQGYSAH